MSEGIIEGNKLIAGFMETGVKPDYYFIDGYLYNSSWNRLMPVVEKIEEINDPHHGYFGVHISSNNCTIQATNFRPNKPMANPPHYFSDHHGESKIQATWFAVIQFLKWYNKNKSSNK